jgi:hypothetical protein
MPNYNEAKSNCNVFRVVWNAVVSMNTVHEFVALEQLDYIYDRQAIDDQSAKIRGEHQSLLRRLQPSENLQRPSCDQVLVLLL